MSSVATRAWIFVVLVVAYLLFLLTVMEFFEEPLPTAATPKVNVLRVASPHRFKSHVRVTPPPPSFSPFPADAPQDLDLLSPGHRALLRRKPVKDDSQMSIHPHPVRICDSGRCKFFYPSGIKPRRSLSSSAPVVRRSGDVVRNVFSWAWGVATKGALGSGREATRQYDNAQTGRDEGAVVNLAGEAKNL
jgi:hypothetical protein